MAQYLPTQVHDSFWVYALEQHLTAQFPNQDGKWMMFFPMSEMDARWNEACQLYRSGRLFGINSMKASTAKQNPMPERLHGPDEGIIIFYCGPCEDEANVMQYGRNILNNMHYPQEKFFYKSDKPHLIDWTKEKKHMYYINTLQHYGGHHAGGFASAAPFTHNSYGSFGASASFAASDYQSAFFNEAFSPNYFNSPDSFYNHLDDQFQSGFYF